MTFQMHVVDAGNVGTAWYIVADLHKWEPDSQFSGTFQSTDETHFIILNHIAHSTFGLKPRIVLNVEPPDYDIKQLIGKTLVPRRREL